MSEAIESVEDFRLRARAWIKENLGPIQPWDLSQHCENDEEERKAVARDRALQRRIYDGGFAGICFPREYGGLGLTPEHNRAFNEELAGHEYPSRFAVPTFSPCAVRPSMVISMKAPLVSTSRQGMCGPIGPSCR